MLPVWQGNNEAIAATYTALVQCHGKSPHPVLQRTVSHCPKSVVDNGDLTGSRTHRRFEKINQQTIGPVLFRPILLGYFGSMWSHWLGLS